LKDLLLFCFLIYQSVRDKFDKPVADPKTVSTMFGCSRSSDDKMMPNSITGLMRLMRKDVIRHARLKV